MTGDFRWGKDENTDDTEGVLFSKKKEESCGISEKEIEIAALGIMSTMSAYLSALGKEKRSVNTGMLAGNGTIRASVKGYASGKLSKEELHQVWKAVEEALSAGALGISLGIAYAPEFEYDRDGLVEALQPLKGTDIPITTHIRNEGDGILLALQEVISVAEELQIPLHVSHMKCIGRKNWGGTPVKILKLFDQAAERGVKVNLLLDGMNEFLYLERSELFKALCTHENVEVRVYNPIDAFHILKGNYRMHDKYLITDDTMYLLGGRNSNDIFLGIGRPESMRTGRSSSMSRRREMESRFRSWRSILLPSGRKAVLRKRRFP